MSPNRNVILICSILMREGVTGPEIANSEFPFKHNMCLTKKFIRMSLSQALNGKYYFFLNPSLSFRKKWQGS